MNRGWNIVLFCAALIVAMGANAFAQTNVGAPQLPPLKSPVDTFRELLNLSPAERMKALADRSEVARGRLLEKLREYQGLSADERELRLRATELRWWLLPLMRQPATSRPAGLNLVPAHLRQLVEVRLQLWGIVPPDIQKELLDNEDVAQMFLQFQGRTPAQREVMLKNLPPGRRKLLEAGLEKWTALSTDERRLTCERFDRYFELSERERARVLSTLSDTERQQMEQTLRSFEQLPREKRIVCVRSFEKFASMDIAERQQFLKNAERWEKMSPAERQAWRNLVSRVPEFPPLPPGAGDTAPSAPPQLPPSFPNTRQPSVTNGGG